MFRKAFQSRLPQAIGGQALVSIFHFSVNLVLLPLLTPADYGLFALSFVLAMFAAAINNALISTPLSIYTPVVKEPIERAEQERMFNAMNTLFSFLLVLLGVSIALQNQEIALVVGLFVASYSTRQFSRCFAYARLRPAVPAIADVIYVSISSLGVLVAIVLHGSESLTMILLALAVSTTAATIAEFYMLRDAWQLPSSLRALRAYAKLWPSTKWALAGALSSMLMAHFHSLIISSSLGPAAFAPLAAGGVLLGPVRVALTTWQNMTKPKLAIALDKGQFSAVAWFIAKITAAMTVVLVGVFLFLWLGWPWIHEYLYAEKYSDQPMWWIVCMWTLITLFVTINAPTAAALQALADFKLLALSSVYGALLNTLIVVGLLFSLGAASTLYGTLAAEIFMMLYLIYQIRKKYWQHTNWAQSSKPNIDGNGS